MNYDFWFTVIVIILLIWGIFLYYLLRKKRHKDPDPPTPPQPIEDPEFTYPNTILKISRSSSITPTIIKGSNLTWTAIDTLPNGLIINSSTGVISGIPTVTSVATNYIIRATNSLGNYYENPVNITINNLVLPSFTYNDITLTRNYNIGLPFAPANVSGNPTSWQIISGTLPTDVNFSSSTGIFSGNPLTLHSNNTITVRASNTDGYTEETFTLNVVQEPIISYSDKILTRTTGTNLPIVPSNTGGPIKLWSISPDISTSITGLTFNTSNGNITGVPTITTVSSGIDFTVTVENYYNVIVSDLFNIKVNAIPPSGARFGQNSYAYTTADTINIVPSASGDPATWTTNRASNLTSVGLGFNSSSGAISGTANNAITINGLTVTATNSGGSSTSGPIQIIIDQPVVTPNPLYTGSPFTFTRNGAISAITPNNLGGTASSWSVNPSLPSGLNFNTTTGVITGTPNTIQTSTSYVVTATNTSGDGSTTINITVNDIPPSINFPGGISTYEFIKDVAITPIQMESTGGTPTSWSSNLPNGLSIDNNGLISGTPTVAAAQASYTITATNSGGSVSKTITIKVLTSASPDISYVPSALTLSKGTAFTSSTPYNLGGAVTSYTIAPDLPNGLSLNSSSGVISGTPTSTQLSTSYVVTATNSSGSDNATISITINPKAPSISYNGPYSFIEDSIITDITPINTGDAATYSLLNPSVLPDGLSLDTSSGIISGTPVTPQTSKTYTIKAQNVSGSSNASFGLTITAKIPSISYNPSSNTFTQGSAITDWTPTINNSTIVDSWSITPVLPQGLNFDTSSGIISGRPTVQNSNTTYTISATNNGGTGSTNIDIAIDPAPATVPIFSYNTSNINQPEGVLLQNLTPNVSGGTNPISYAISPDLSSLTGLNFDTTTGVISGTPNVIINNTTFNITATDSSGHTYVVSLTFTVSVPPLIRANIPLNVPQSYGMAFGTVYDNNNIYYTGFYNTYANSQEIAAGVILPATYPTQCAYIIKTGVDLIPTKQTTFKAPNPNTTGYTGFGSTAGYSIAKDSFGNIYITGVYSTKNSEIITIASGITLPATNNSQAAFLVKYTSDLVPIWAKGIVNISNNTYKGCISYKVAVDSQDNVIICGKYSTLTGVTIPVQDSYVLGDTENGTGAFIIKYDSSGAILFLKNLITPLPSTFNPASISPNVIDTINPGYIEALSLTIDSNDDIYITGNYYSATGNPVGTADNCNVTPFINYVVNSASLQFVPADNSRRMYIMKLNKTSGNAITAVSNYNLIPKNTAGFSGSINTISIDSSNNLYVAGYYLNNNNSHVGYYVNSNVTIPYTGSLQYIVIMKYSSALEALWSNNVKGAGTSFNGVGIYSIVVDSNANTYFNGEYNYPSGSQTVGSVVIPASSADPSAGEAILLKFNSNGEAIWVRNIKSTNNSNGTNLTFDSISNLYQVGHYASNVPIDIPNSSNITLPATGPYIRPFLLKYGKEII